MVRVILSVSKLTKEGMLVTLEHQEGTLRARAEGRNSHHEEHHTEAWRQLSARYVH